MSVTEDNIATGYRKVAEAFFAKMPLEQQERARRLGELNKIYVTTPRDEKIAQGIEELCQNAAAELFGQSGKRRALFVIGESDSGKTETIMRHLAKREELRPYVNEDGDTIRPLVSFEAPKPMTIKGFARTALDACGYPVTNPRLTEMELFELLKKKIRESGTLFMFVDEMQHVIKNDKTEDIQNVSDVIKSLLQMPGWPLHMILSGVPSLAKILNPEDAAGVDTDRQLRNRSLVVEMKPLNYPVDIGLVRNVQSFIARKCDLKIDGTDSDEFMARLFHACNNSFGTIIQTVKRAGGFSVNETADALAARHFAKVYALNTDCRSSENIFICENWREIPPGRLSFSDRAKTLKDQEIQGEGKVSRSKRKTK